MNAELGSWGSQAARLTWVALRSWIATVLAWTLFGGNLAGLSYYVLREEHWMYSGAAAAAALLEGVTVGLVLGVKRSVLTAAEEGLDRWRLGREVVQWIFEQMLGVRREAEFGERGGRAARTLERLPLAQADELLNGTIRRLSGDAEQGGWLRRKVRARLLAAVHQCTLARFRAEGAAHGGVDLLKVQADLAQSVDETLLRAIRGERRRWTTLALIGLPCVAAAQTWLLLLLLRFQQ